MLNLKDFSEKGSPLVEDFFKPFSTGNPPTGCNENETAKAICNAKGRSLYRKGNRVESNRHL